MRNSKNNLPIELFSLRKRALINLIVIPLYLIIFFGLIFLQWRISINWIAAPDLKTKLFWLAIGLFLIVVAIVLGYYVKRFSKWVYSGKLHDPSKKNNQNT
jgi:predicted metal-dependent hydrolase